MNAIRIDGSDKHMPEWSSLADIFCKKIGMDLSDPTNRYSDPLMLAQQVEELYGKSYMNNLLRDIMEDDSYRPGNAHDLLIALPWSDVFTTNYDTLLERAYQSGTKRRYKIVYNHYDLLYSAGTPRIVKLHGSFPSYEPFIISAEDYRRYPINHAPFVNTVQQSLLENLFILIGFSGNDPNFLKWIGWIHDNLGLQNSPRMYMVVHKRGAEVSTKMLAAKNIDLIILNDIEKYHSDNYKESLELFLTDLNQRINNDNLLESAWLQASNTSYQDNIEEVLDNLKKMYANYPGWITARFQYLLQARHIISNAEFVINVGSFVPSVDKNSV